MDNFEDLILIDPFLINDKTVDAYHNELLANFFERTNTLKAALSDVDGSINPPQFREVNPPNPVLSDRLKQLVAKLDEEYWNAAAERRSFQEELVSNLVREFGDLMRRIPPVGETTSARNEYKLRRALSPVGGIIDGARTEDRGRTIFEERSVEKLPDRIRIAAIGHRVPIALQNSGSVMGESLEQIPHTDNDVIFKRMGQQVPVAATGRTCCFRVGEDKLDAELRTRWDDLEKKLEYALAYHADIVMAPEFAMPHGPDCTDEKSAEARIEKLCNRHNDHDFLLFSGSRHDGPYNRGLVARKLRGEDCSPQWHYKFASSRPLGENILGPTGRHFPIYHVELNGEKYNIAIPICYDAYDPSVFRALAFQKDNDDTKNSSRFTKDRTLSESLPIVLVPSYNTASKFIEFLRDISILNQCLVVYANSLHGDVRLFLYGIAIRDLRDKDRRMEIIASLEERLNEIATERDELNKEVSNPSVQWDRPKRQLYDDLTRQAMNIPSVIKHLNDLEHSEAFDQLLTIGKCEKCEENERSGASQWHYDCLRDVVFYNIPMGLVRLCVKIHRLLRDKKRLVPNSMLR